jgi:hypothetical protein
LVRPEVISHAAIGLRPRPSGVDSFSTLSRFALG